MSNVLSEEKKQQVLALGRLGWTLRRIEDVTGVRRETAGTYLRAAGIAVRGRGGWGWRGLPKPAMTAITDSAAEPAITVITDPAAVVGEDGASTGPPGRCPSASACEPYREWIEVGLGLGRNAKAIYQDLVDDHGFGFAYASVMRYVRTLRESQPEPRGTIVTPPGEEAQVDYGKGPMVRDPITGKYRRTWLFVMTLGHSRKSVRLLTFRSSSKIWAQLHETAFRRLGGVTRVVVLDNLKEGVLRTDIYDPALNPLYRDVLLHYGVVGLPCRVRDPDRKGKVEMGVGHAKKTPLKGLRFESLEAAQAYLDRWEERWGDTRIHGTTKRQVAAMFAEERPALKPLPIEPFRYYEFGTRTVHLDGNVEIAGAYYFAPPGRIGAQLPVQWDERQARILDPRTGELLREFSRQAPGGYRRQDGDAPTRTAATTLQVLARAKFAGHSIGVLSEEIVATGHPAAVRRVLGLLSLAKKHGPTRVARACTAALEIGVPSYRFVRKYLDHHGQQMPLSLRQVDPLIRELTHYRDIVNSMMKETPE